jgi:anti-sigma regulatory factor (Ser/Thr protein kinase)
VKTGRTFAPDPASVPAARRFVLDTVGHVAPDLRDVISVMVSELAMNAVQYAHTEFGVRVELSGEVLRVEVTDSGGGNPVAQPLPPPGRPHGRGLLIVHRLADEWGVTRSRNGTGKTVWFRIAVKTSPRPITANLSR